MKTIHSSQIVNIPEGVDVKAKSRLITVKGPRGELKKTFSHVDMELKFLSKTKLQVTLWHAGRKHAACMRTVCTHIKNMIKGVTQVNDLFVHYEKIQQY
jgi:large subunit ribosomal protein L9e